MYIFLIVENKEYIKLNAFFSIYMKNLNIGGGIFKLAYIFNFKKEDRKIY